MPVDKFMGDSTGCGAAQTATWGSPVGLVHRAGDTMLGTLSMGGFQLKDVASPKAPQDAATKGYVDTRDALPASGGSMRGALHMGGNEITGLASPTAAQSAAPKSYVDGVVSTALTLVATKEYVDTRDILPTSGGSMRGALDMGGNEITGLADPKTNQSAATKKYVDALARSTTGLLDAKVLQLDGSKAPTHDIGWGNHRISQLADPKAPQDAATRAYVDKKYMRRFDRYNFSLAWDSPLDSPDMPASLESVTGQHYSTLLPKPGGLIVKKPGFYTVLLVGTYTAEYTGVNQQFTIEYHIDSPPGVVKNKPSSRAFSFLNIIEISQENTAIRLNATTGADLLWSLAQNDPFPQLVIRATLLIEKLL